MSVSLSSKKRVQRFIRKDRKRTPLLAIFLLLLSFSLLQLPRFGAVWPQESLAILQKEEPVWVGVFGGDIIYDAYVARAQHETGLSRLFTEVDPWLTGADYFSVNLSGPIPAESSSAGGFEREIARILATEGVDVVSLANNHVMDLGAEGLLDTMGALTYHKLSYVGAGVNLAEASRIHLHEKGKIRVATLAFNHINTTENTAGAHTPGVLPAYGNHFASLIRRAKGQADLVIVHLHFGSSRTDKIGTGDEDLAKAMIDSGADVVIGHHSRRLKAVEVYNDGIILYSLGVLVGAQGTSREKETALVHYSLLKDGTAAVRLIPLFSVAGIPRQISGLLAGYRHWRMNHVLADRLEVWQTDTLGCIVFTMDHSHVLKGVLRHET